MTPDMYRWRLPRRHTIGNLLGSEGLGERSRQAQICGYNKAGIALAPSGLSYVGRLRRPRNTFERSGQPLIHG